MLETSFKLPSFAKINWILRIKGKRNDGFHELCTVFQTVSLFDNLDFSEANELILTCNAEGIPTDERNLIIKAAKILQEKFGIKRGAKIHLEKRIPAPGGLGGGSSNAAISLLGLAKLWNLAISFNELMEIGQTLGSDVPFFFFGGTAIGTGRGTEIFQKEDFSENNILIITPDVNVPTKNAFALLDAPRLTNFDSKSILQICRVEAQALNLRQSGLINDFENAVFKIEPEIKRVKEKLFDLGAKYALMSGSGASVFAVFDSREELQTAFDVLQIEKTWRKFKVETVSLRDYLQALDSVKSLLH
jgi:4-diphosphocytidyl-2-C-methyl-D-erythritol kinase